MAYRIMVLGSSCAGKTTLACMLAEALKLKQIDLDDLRFLPKWQERTEEDFRGQIRTAIQDTENWVISGSFSSSWDITMPLATHVIFIDLPLSTLLRRLFFRTCRRVVRRESVCNGNRENGSAFFILSRWIISQYKIKRRKFEDVRKQPYNPATKFIRLTRVGDVQTVLNAL